MIKDFKFKNAILKARGSELHNDPLVARVDDKPRELTDVERVIYQVNPRTGFPCNDLEMQDDLNTRLEIREALAKRNYPTSSDTPYTENDDLVLDGIQKNDESDIAYANRLKDIANQSE